MGAKPTVLINNISVNQKKNTSFVGFAMYSLFYQMCTFSSKRANICARIKLGCLVGASTGSLVCGMSPNGRGDRLAWIFGGGVLGAFVGATVCAYPFLPIVGVVLTVHNDLNKQN